MPPAPPAGMGLPLKVQPNIVILPWFRTPAVVGIPVIVVVCRDKVPEGLFRIAIARKAEHAGVATVLDMTERLTVSAPWFQKQPPHWLPVSLHCVSVRPVT